MDNKKLNLILPKSNKEIKLNFIVQFKDDFIDNGTSNKYSLERFITTIENSLSKGSTYDCLSISMLSLTWSNNNDNINLDKGVDFGVKWVYNNEDSIYRLFGYIYKEACDKILYEDKSIFGLNVNFIGISMSTYDLPMFPLDSVIIIPDDSLIAITDNPFLSE